MEQEVIEQIEAGMETAFVDSSTSSNLAYRPEFISNNYREGQKVLSSIEDELLSCEEFSISVAFITMGGITPLLQTLKVLENRGIPGRILTTDYLNFSEPKALEKLAELSNISLKMYMSSESQEGFHTKGYIFKSQGVYRMIVGSANMTLNALTRNQEWSTKLVCTEEGEYSKQIAGEFDQLWKSEYAVAYDDFIEPYSQKYALMRKQRKIALEADIYEYIVNG